MRTTKTYTDYLVDLINQSTLTTSQIVVVDKLIQRESTELTYVAPTECYNMNAQFLLESRDVSEIITLYHSIKICGKVCKMEIDMAGLTLTSWDFIMEDRFQYEVSGVVIAVRGGFLVTEEIHKHFYPAPRNRRLGLIPTDMEYYGSDKKSVWTLVNVNDMKRYTALKPGCPNNKRK